MPKAPVHALIKKFFLQSLNKRIVRVTPSLTQLKQIRIKGQAKISLRSYDVNPIVVLDQK